MEWNPNKPRVLYLCFMEVNNDVKPQSTGELHCHNKACDAFKTPHVKTGSVAQVGIALATWATLMSQKRHWFQ